MRNNSDPQEPTFTHVRVAALDPYISPIQPADSAGQRARNLPRPNTHFMNKKQVPDSSKCLPRSGKL